MFVQDTFAFHETWLVLGEVVAAGWAAMFSGFPPSNFCECSLAYENVITTQKQPPNEAASNLQSYTDSSRAAYVQLLLRSMTFSPC
jgi:hypothetical protein